MHMADALISPATALVMSGAAALTLASAVRKAGEDKSFTDEKTAMMGIMGAFVFASQMINFAIPGTGSSGHIGGGLLLAAILGPAPAYLAMAVVLIIQCLLFADGGLMALGCNIFNMGFLTTFAAYQFIFRPLAGHHPTKSSIMKASVISGIAGLVMGSTAVVLETVASGITELPFTTFITLMVPVHIAIGAVEGVITGAVLSCIYEVNRNYLDFGVGRTAPSGDRRLKAGLGIATLVIAAVISLYASSSPDGLEWSVAGVLGNEELSTFSVMHNGSQQITDATALMPDYTLGGSSVPEPLQTSAAGITGSFITLGLAVITGKIIRKRKNNCSSCK